MEILTFLASGMPRKAVAKKLGIAIGTVDYHVSKMYRKLNVSVAVHALFLIVR